MFDDNQSNNRSINRDFSPLVGQRRLLTSRRSFLSILEWFFGSLGCKLSTFINSCTSCASIFTLVAVTADRYAAICHTLKYALWDASYTLYVIFGIWLISGLLASPNLVTYDEVRHSRQAAG